MNTIFFNDQDKCWSSYSSTTKFLISNLVQKTNFNLNKKVEFESFLPIIAPPQNYDSLDSNFMVIGGAEGWNPLCLKG